MSNSETVASNYHHFFLFPDVLAVAQKFMGLRLLSITSSYLYDNKILCNDTLCLKLIEGEQLKELVAKGPLGPFQKS